MAKDSGPAPRPGARAGFGLAEWFAERVEFLGTTWVDELRLRGLGGEIVRDGVMERFLLQLVRMLPHLLGPDRTGVRPLWDEACELFGVTAAKRGLAAGEVVEELHVLREIVIRELFRAPPQDPEALSLRPVLRLNRTLDRGVTYASVGHTDAMFYQYLEPEAPPTPTLEAVAEEVGARLDALWGDLQEVVGPLGADAPASVRH